MNTSSVAYNGSWSRDLEMGLKPGIKDEATQKIIGKKILETFSYFPGKQTSIKKMPQTGHCEWLRLVRLTHNWTVSVNTANRSIQLHNDKARSDLKFPTQFLTSKVTSPNSDYHLLSRTQKWNSSAEMGLSSCHDNPNWKCQEFS